MTDTKYSINVSFLSLFLNKVSALKIFYSTYATALFPDNGYHNGWISLRAKIKTKDNKGFTAASNTEFWLLGMLNWIIYVFIYVFQEKSFQNHGYPKDRNAIVAKLILRKQILVSESKSLAVFSAP